MKVRSAAFALVVGLGFYRCAQAQDTCSAVPLPIEDLSNIRETYLLLQSASGTNYYVVSDSCVIVDREIFGTTLQFSLFNRLIKNGPRIGTAYVK